MASSSSTFSTAIAHGHFSNLTPSILHSLNAEILPSDLIFYTGVPEQYLQVNYYGLPAEATHCADQLGGGGGGVQHNNGMRSIEEQNYPASFRTLDESDDREWLIGALDGIITTNTTSEYPQMVESAPVFSSLNSETRQQERMINQSVTVPSNPQQVYPTVSPPATKNAHCPKRTKARMRWTMEMHDRFIDAVKQLGGSECAKPKAILEIMNVEGLNRDQVKSHLQKYKSAQVKHRSSEVAGTSVETTTSDEPIPSDVQTRIEEFALKMQIEFQKKLHDMVEMTRHDLLEIHRSILENHVNILHGLEERQNLNTDRSSTAHLLSGAAAACSGSASGALAALLVGPPALQRRMMKTATPRYSMTLDAGARLHYQYHLLIESCNLVCLFFVFTWHYPFFFTCINSRRMGEKSG